MPTTYKVRRGDTFDSIARSQDGTESDSGRIARSNPGVLEPLTEGITLTIPDNPGAPKNAVSQALVDNQDEVTILINGERFVFWQEVALTLTMDSVARVQFTAPFEPDNPAFRSKFRPFSFSPIEINIGNAPAFTGTLIDISPRLTPTERTVSVNAYSLPGVLSDCSPPSSAFPLEFNGQGVRDIATSLAGFFGLNVDFEDEQGPVFERVACNPGRRTLDFLVDLLKQRNLVLSSSKSGALKVWKSIGVGAPVARLSEGSSPLTSVRPNFNPQDYFSDITGVEPVTLARDGSKFTVRNPLLEGVIRPETFTAQDTEAGGLPVAVQAKVGRMFGNMVSYDIQVTTWRAPNGDLWAENTTILLVAPGAMIYTEYEFIIRSVVFGANRNSKFATLNLVLPGAFSGETPGALPWDG